VVSADVVLVEPAPEGAQPSEEALKEEILAICRRELAPYKVPATVRIVAALELSAAGKLVRPRA
jgi:acyl-CoA synthetase (AMP-forming)/AMP-acid ligase II